MQSIIYTIKKTNKPILALILLMVVTIFTTTYHNHKKEVNETNLKNLLNNIYLKKTLSNIFNQLDPKYEKIEYLIRRGDSLNSIFEKYNIDKNDLQLIKNDFLKKNKVSGLKINDILEFTIDRSTQKIVELSYPVSKTKKLYIFRNKNLDKFNEKVITTNLTKKIIYNENVIV